MPAGADPEESGEALLARLVDAPLSADAEPADAASAALVKALRDADTSIAPAPPSASASVRVAAPDAKPVHVTLLRAGSGVEIAVSRHFARFRVPFQHRGEDAESVFDRLFRLLGAVSAATGWRAYDPQEAEGVALDDAGRDATLEIYLTVMDQLRPAGTGLRP